MRRPDVSLLACASAPRAAAYAGSLGGANLRCNMRLAFLAVSALTAILPSSIAAQASGGVHYLDSAGIAQMIRDSRTRPLWITADSNSCAGTVDSLVGLPEPLGLGTAQWVRPRNLKFQWDSLQDGVQHVLWRSADSSFHVEAVLGTTDSLGTGIGGGYWGFIAPQATLPDGRRVGPTHCADCLQITHRCWARSGIRVYYVASGQFHGWGPSDFSYSAAYPLADDRYLIVELTSPSEYMADEAWRLFRSVRPEQ
jgi:hypothetical protein